MPEISQRVAPALTVGVGTVVPANRQSYWLAACCYPVFGAGLAWLMQGKLPVSVGAATSLFTLLGLIVVCGITDIRWKIIPNWATYTAFVWALLISGLSTIWGSSEPRAEQSAIFLESNRLPLGFSECLAGALTCFLIMLTIHSMSKGGAGDVKLAAAIGAFVGVKTGLLAICYTFILAGVMSLAIVIWTLGLWFLLKAVGRWIGSLLIPTYVQPPSSEQSRILKRPLALGVFFAIGTVLAVLDVPGLIK